MEPTKKIQTHYKAVMELLGDALKEESPFDLLKLNCMPSREGLNLRVTSQDPEFQIKNVSQILNDPAQSSAGIDKIEKTGSQTDRPKCQDRFTLTKEVIKDHYDYDPRIPILHDKEKIGSFKADRYLMEIEYKGEPVVLIVTNWYAHAIYLTKKSNYNNRYSREDLQRNGAKRIYWNNETVTHEYLHGRIQEKGAGLAGRQL